jgi:transglutaminase-like putative cysteine protease
MFKLKIIFIIFLLFIIIVSSVFSQEFSSEVIKNLTFYDVTKDKIIQIDSVTLQINNRSGENQTYVRIPYTKNQKISNIEAWIEDANGTIVRKLKNTDIEERSNISDYSLYEDDFVKTFQLKHNAYPYRIFYTYKMVAKDFVSLVWTPVKYTSVPTRFARITYLAPINYRIKEYTHDILASKTTTLDNTLKYTWESNYLKPLADEIYSASNLTLVPYVMIMPIHFFYGVEGSCENWVTFGNWVYRLIKDLDVLPDEEKERVDGLIKGIKDKRQIVKTLYHYMQDHTRYINVTIGIGGLKPFPASYVAQNKYGDCKALSNYMKALLKQAGIPSYYTVIFRGNDPYEVMKDFPGPQYFNHAILTVPLGKDTIWLENTNNTGPFESISPDIQGREALLVDEYNSKIIRIPGLNKQNLINCWKFDVRFSEAGHADVEMKASFRGDNFDYFNQLKSDLNKSEQDEIIRKIIRISNYDLLSWNLTKPHRDSAKMDLSLRFTIYKEMKALGDEKYFSPLGIGVPLFSASKERVNPVKINCPIYKVDTIAYHLPIGYEIKSVPSKIEVSSVFGKYELLVEANDSIIDVVKKFELYGGTYSLKEYPDFYKFISTVNEKEKLKILIKKKI